MELSKFTIAFVIVSMITAIIGVFLVGMNDKYSTDFDESELDAYNTMSSLQKTAGEMNQTITNIEQGSDVDIVGGYLSSGIIVVKTTYGSYKLFGEVANAGLENAQMGTATPILKQGFFLIAILLIIFTIAAILIGRDRL
jgi:NADH:ubiquinone oxidoreductase subunit 3 (subunit A)